MNNDKILELILYLLAASYSIQWSGIPFYFENPIFNCHNN